MDGADLRPLDVGGKAKGEERVGDAKRGESTGCTHARAMHVVQVCDTVAQPTIKLAIKCKIKEVRSKRRRGQQHNTHVSNETSS